MVRINSYKDLQPGDVWLGLTVSSKQRAYRDVVYFGDDRPWMMDHAVQALIDAGNDEVERTPEEVTFETTVHKVGNPCVAMFGSCAEIQPFIGMEVEVKVRKL